MILRTIIRYSSVIRLDAHERFQR